MPIYSESVPKLIWHNFSKRLAFKPNPTNSEAVKKFKNTLTAEGVKTFDAYPAFCTNGCDIMDQDMHPFYFDSGHLTLTGAERLRPVVEDLLTWLIQKNKNRLQRQDSGNAVQQGAQPDGVAAG